MSATNDCFAVIICAGAVVLSLSVGEAFSQPKESALQLEAKIPLGDVSGRVDHMAIDLKHHRLFVTELGNNSVGVVDLNQRKVINVVAGLRQPQGVGYHQSTDTLYVANAGDGSVRMFRASDYSEVGRIDLKEDADNILVDDVTDRIIVGYGMGRLL
jgi:YVTN family beta-propeller protein